MPVSGGEVNFRTLVVNDRGSAGFHGTPGKELLGDVHEVMEVGIGPVEFAGSELGVVPGVYAFVAEVAVDLEDFLKAAHKQAL